MKDHVPPHSLEAEQVVLAAALRSADYRRDILAEVRKADFFLDAHQKLFDAMLTLDGKGQPCDPAAVYHLLVERRQAEDVGVKYIGQVWTDWAGHRESAAEWRHYAAAMREKAKARRIIHACTEAIRDAYSPAGPMDELVGDVERKLFDIGTGSGSPADEMVSLDDAMKQAVAGIDARQAGGGERPTTTGFDSLDQILGGFWRGDLTVLAARPSVGKTALGLAFALHTLQHAPTAFFSMEMSRVEIANRALAFRASVPLNAIRGAKEFQVGEYAAVIAAQKSDPYQLWIDDRSNLSASEIARVVRREVRRRGVRLVVVDYLQRMDHDRKAGDRHDLRVGDTAKRLKTLARDCNVPVLCLAQLNRQVESRGEAEPKLSDLRDSGEIEQEADNVLMLHPAPAPSYDPTIQNVSVLVHKQRNGPQAKTSLVFRRPYTRFE